MGLSDVNSAPSVCPVPLQGTQPEDGVPGRLHNAAGGHGVPVHPLPGPPRRSPNGKDLPPLLRARGGLRTSFRERGFGEVNFHLPPSSLSLSLPPPSLSLSVSSDVLSVSSSLPASLSFLCWSAAAGFGARVRPVSASAEVALLESRGGGVFTVV